MDLLSLLFAVALLVCSVGRCDEILPTKATPPTAEERLPIEKQIREIFAGDLAGRSSSARAATALKFLDEADKSREDPAASFVLLEHARDSAISAGSATLAWKASSSLARRYRIDGSTLKIDTLIALNSQPLSPAEADVAAEHAMRLIESAVSADDFATVARIGPIAEALAVRSHNSGLSEAIHRHVATGRTLAAQYAPVKTALDVLKTRPDDADSSGVVGKYLCMSKGDWSRGIALLAHSGDPLLGQLARQELTNSGTAKEEKGLADGWWAVADKFTGSTKAAVRAHAADWYARALDGLTGLEQALVRKRISEIPLPSNYPIDLMAMIDLKRDAVRGSWILKDGILSNNASVVCGLMIPYEPPEEYDFIIEFTRLGGRDQVWQVFPTAKSQLFWSMGAWGRKLFLAEASGELVKSDDPSCTASGVKFSSVVKVRHSGVQVLLNGKQIAASNGPFDNLPAQDIYALPSGKALGIGAWNGVSASFSKIVVIPVTGTGHSLAVDEE